MQKTLLTVEQIYERLQTVALVQEQFIKTYVEAVCSQFEKDLSPMEVQTILSCISHSVDSDLKYNFLSMMYMDK